MNGNARRVKTTADLPKELGEKLESLAREDARLWEERLIGADSAHIVRAPEEIESQINAAKRSKEDRCPISIRVPITLLTDIKKLAEDDNIGYQTLILQVMSRYVKDKKKRA